MNINELFVIYFKNNLSCELKSHYFLIIFFLSMTICQFLFKENAFNTCAPL